MGKANRKATRKFLEDFAPSRPELKHRDSTDPRVRAAIKDLREYGRGYKWRVRTRGKTFDANGDVIDHPMIPGLCGPNLDAQENTSGSETNGSDPSETLNGN